MSKGPGIFSEIGKKAKDLLTKDYLSDHKFSVSTCTESGGLECSCLANIPSEVPKYGMPILVGVAYALSFGFFVFHRTGTKY